ncbi:5622_t:CDS:1 [Cetraspora pellucida]|uniref:5622_t:CDS:1 n=1 Tax=Cetraspora pellucida TaxID=1433469 RepID=A0A9N9AZS7_9GLOM|nr:5622_t:CDS:1 [Cetraspora pellucida]
MNYKQIIEHIIEFYPNFLNNPVINDIEEIVHLISNPLKITNDRAIIALNVEHIARNEVHITDKEAIRMATTYFLSLFQHRQNRNQRNIYKNLAYMVNRYNAIRNRFHYQNNLYTRPIRVYQARNYIT